MAASVAIKLVAEFLGTFLLMVSILTSGGNYLIIGATLGVIVFLISGISGAPVNPAVSAGLWYSGNLSTQMFALYSLAEIFGGLAAAYSYKIVG
jgi:glycerol uptake facilitator-like aquaporin